MSLKVNLNNQKPFIELSVIVLGIILITFLYSYVAIVTFQNQIPNMLGIWNHWDAPHYINISQNGYTNTGEWLYLIVYFPLYPLLIKPLGVLLDNYVLSALIVSNIAYAVSAFYLYKLVMLDYPHGNKAMRTVFYYSIFPTAYFLHAGYTESLFLALTIPSFYYARLGKWWLACIFGMLASGTRITGIFLLPALFYEYISQKGFKIPNIRKDILWLGIVPIGFAIYLLINYIVFGDPFKFREILRDHWFKNLGFPWVGFLSALGSASWRIPSDRIMMGWAEIVFAVLGLLLTIAVFIWVRISYGIYILLTWLIVACSTFWMSIPRYTLSMFPIFIVLSLVGKYEWANILIVFLSIIFYGMFLARFVIGWWAF